jgi:hypothetical protein
MPSPFPGVDPYLEEAIIWQDFQAEFLRQWRNLLHEQLPSAYEAHLHERERLIDLSREQYKNLVPDLESLIQQRLGPRNSLELDLDPRDKRVAITQRVKVPYLTIRRKTSRKLVTVVEVFVLGTKSYCGGHDYTEKRKAQLNEPVHLVELDLLVSGYRMPLPSKAPPSGDCFAFIWHRKRRPYCSAVGWTVRQPIPTIGIPLRDPDPDFRCDLAKVFTLAYDAGGFAKKVKYYEACPAQLDMGDLFWAQELVREKGVAGEPPMPEGR